MILPPARPSPPHHFSRFFLAALGASPSKSRVLRPLRTLFLSWRSFRRSPRLFSIPCGLFVAKHRGYGVPLRHLRACPLFRRPIRYHLPFFAAPLFSSTYKSLLAAHRFATFSVFMHLQIPFSATSLYSHLYKTPGCGIQIMVNHRLSHAQPRGGSFFRGIKEFDSYERNFGIESGCWSIIRATNRAAQPRELRPNTRVKTRAVTGRSPKPAAGRVAATKGGSQQMNRIPVSSQGILEVGYHEDADSRGTLELKFSNGGVYEFFNVPTKMYDEFMHAPSRDDYYRTNIGKRFPCTRVG